MTKSEQIACALFVAAMALYLSLAIHLMGGLDFNDETEKYIAAQLLVKGYRIYGDLFLMHGPTAYMLSHIFHSVFGFHGVAASRVLPIGLSLMAIASVMCSPALTSLRGRFVAGTIMAIGLAATQASFSLVQTMYQVYAGYFYIIAAALFLLPLALGKNPKPWHAVAAGLCLALTFFCAISFVMAIGFFCLACLFVLAMAKTVSDKWRITTLLAYGILGAILGTAAVCLWLRLYGDLLGYLVVHIYFAVTYYTHYLVGFSLATALNILVPGLPAYLYRADHAMWSHGAWFTHILLGMPSVYMALVCLGAWRAQSLGKTIIPYGVFGLLIAASSIYMDPRDGISFQSSSIVIVACGLCALIGAILIESHGFGFPVVRKVHALFLAGLLVSCVVAQLTTQTWLYELQPTKYYGHKGTLNAEQSSSMDFVRSFVGKDDGILSLPYSLTEHIRADRRPAFGIFYWMPWQNDYAKTPIPGYPFDFCKQLKDSPPKAIFYTDNLIWGNPADTFLGCVKTVLRDTYVRSINVDHLWIRTDIVAARPDVLALSLIPADFNTNAVPASARESFERAKVTMGVLKVATSSSCVDVPIQKDESTRDDLVYLDGVPITHELVSTTHCDKPQKILLGFQGGGKDVHIVGMSGFFSKDIQCLEVSGALTTEGAPTRFWPCMDIQNQIFTRDHGKQGDKLRAKHSNLCLGVKDNQIIQTDCAKAREWVVR